MNIYHGQGKLVEDLELHVDIDKTINQDYALDISAKSSLGDDMVNLSYVPNLLSVGEAKEKAKEKVSRLCNNIEEFLKTL